MPDISLILFDLNGVLYRYDRDRRIAALSATTGVPPDAIAAAIWDSGFEAAAMPGRWMPRPICAASRPGWDMHCRRPPGWPRCRRRSSRSRRRWRCCPTFGQACGPRC